MKTPQTLQQAIQYFSNYENCKDFMVALRWPNGIHCPTCGSDRVVFLENAKLFKCYGKHAKAKFSLKTGTIFEDSPIGLDKWLPVMWLIVNCKNGISSHEIGREMGVTQKTAWFMLQRARLAMQEATGVKLSGEVEVDESFIGGKSRNMHAGKREQAMATLNKGKTIAVGMVERGGRVKTAVVERRNKKNLQALVRENVAEGSAVFSDELLSYEGLDGDYVHAVINHALEYVNENVHTNTMENFWSLVKRQLRGTYICVEPFHLFRYLDEQAFRYNYRNYTNAERFAFVMNAAVGKRLTYAEVTGKVNPPEPVN